MSRWSALLMLVAGCGGAPKPATPSGPDCGEVAAHLVVLAERDNGAAMAADVAAGVRSEGERQCRDEAWSEERRRCIAAASSQDETLACPPQ